MAIRQVTQQAEIANTINEALSSLDRVTIRCMMVAGEQGANEARANGEYLDQTGNLRSSVGCKVAYNGVVVASSAFDKVRNGDKGSRIGNDFAKSIAESIHGKHCLVLVAGMDYAPYLQAKGRKVLGDAEEVTSKSLTRQFNDLGLKRK